MSTTAPKSAPRRAWALLLPVCLAAACADGGRTGTGPLPTGAVQVTVTTTGRVLDRDGYAVTAQGQTAAVQGNAPATLRLPEGSHVLQLGGVAENCRVQGAESATVQVRAGATAQARFAVVCRADRVAYVATNEAGEPGLYVERLDGGDRRRLLFPAVASPVAWAPDGHRIAFTAHRPGPPAGGREVRVMDVATGVQTVLAANAYTSTEPAWSPDGSRLAFRAQGENTVACNLWVVNADGTGARQLTDGWEWGLCYAEPQWSPDGSRILSIVADMGGGKTLAWLDAQTGATIQSADWRGKGVPVLSPDGSRLAYLSGTIQNGQTIIAIHTSAADGTGDRAVSVVPAGGPVAWISDSALAVSSVHNTGLGQFRTEVWNVNLDGSGLARSPVGAGLVVLALDWQ